MKIATPDEKGGASMIDSTGQSIGPPSKYEMQEASTAAAELRSANTLTDQSRPTKKQMMRRIRRVANLLPVHSRT